MAEDDLGGEDDKHIATLDADGAMFGAIQGLNEKLTKVEAENRDLRKRLDRLEATRPVSAAGMSAGNSAGFLALGAGLAGLFIRRRRDAANPANCA